MDSATNSNGLPRVLVLDPIHPDGLALLRTVAEVDVVTGTALTSAELCDRIDQYQAVINRGRTPIGAEAIERGGQLRIIARAGMSVDNIAVEAAEAHGITVVSAPEPIAAAVAEMTFALMLGIARKISLADQMLKSGRWEREALVGDGLAGKTLGIVGLGRIGREVARRALAFDMRVIVNQTRATGDLAEEWRVEQVELGELLRQADYVTIHVSLRTSNQHLLGAAELARMKPTAYLINAASGDIVDEEALVAALDAGLLAGAALDVFAQEPCPDPRLVNHPRVLATPHIAASTRDTRRATALTVAERVVAALGRQRRAEALSLRVVPTEQVFPHERYHAPRVERLKRRLLEENRLVNPPVVAAMVDGRYVVLDGATRVTAFKDLGLPHIVVQVVDLHRGGVKMNTWFHVVHGNSAAELIQVVGRVDGLRLTPMAADQLPHALWERSALGYLLTPDHSGYLLELTDRLSEDGDWIDVLVDLVDSYGRWGDVGRTLDTDLDALLAQHADLAGLFVYPQFSPDIVLQVAAKGKLLPAGITRFVIPGRILRLNAPLDLLAAGVSLGAKADWLDDLVDQKLANRGLRYYEEPVMLLDE